MAITATKIVNRDVYELKYENSTGEGMVTAKLHNNENGDKSSKKAHDDGTLDVTVAAGWTGEDHVTITHDDGTVLDEDDVTFG